MSTVYTLIKYRPNGVDFCRGCVMGQSDSDFSIETFDDKDVVIQAWAKEAAEAPEGYEYCSTEFTLLINGMPDTWTYENHELYQSFQEIQEKALMEAERLKKIKIEEQQQVEKAARRAEKDRIEANERKKLKELQEKYGISK